MTTIITRLFDTYEHASLAVAELETAGIPHSSVSLVANNADDRYTNVLPGSHAGTMPSAHPSDTTGAGAGTGATIGTVLGGGAGLLAGLGMLAIPGIGPVVAAGWLIATAVGAGVGAASGGLIGSLVGAGVAETDAHVYAEGVRRGGTLVTVRAEDHQVPTVEAILDKHNPVDSSARAEEYRSEGWSRFDEASPPYTPAGTVRPSTTVPFV